MPFGVKVDKTNDVKKITQISIQAFTNTVKSLLGPKHTLKCIIGDEEDPQIVGDGYFLLKALKIRNPFLKILKKITVSHHRELGTGTKTLLSLSGILSIKILQLEEPISETIHYLKEGFEICKEILQVISIPLHSAVNDFDKTSSLLKSNPSFWQNIGGALSHGKSIEMNLAIQAADMLTLQKKSADWTLNSVKVLCVQGPEAMESFVFNGIILQVSDADKNSIKEILHFYKSMKYPEILEIALLEGDLQIEFEENPTFNKEEDITKTLLQRQNQVERIANNILNSISQLKVKVFIISGRMEPAILNLLRNKNILVLQNVPVDILESFSSLSGASIVGDITQLEKPLLGYAKFQVLENGWMNAEDKLYASKKSAKGKFSSLIFLIEENLFLLKVMASIDSKLQYKPPVTAVLHSITSTQTKDMELRFWNCLNRLKNTAQSGVVLPGAGIPEIHCIIALEKEAEVDNPPQKEGIDSSYRKIILQVLADSICDLLLFTLTNEGIGWSDALSIVMDAKKLALEKKKMKPPLECLNEIPFQVFDDFQAKVQCIRRAVLFASLCIDIDCILTNTDDVSDTISSERENWSVLLQ